MSGEAAEKLRISQSRNEKKWARCQNSSEEEEEEETMLSRITRTLRGETNLGSSDYFLVPFNIADR